MLIKKIEQICQDIINTFGVKFFLTLSSSGYESVQKSSLKLLQSFIEFDFGKRHFEAADGAKFLTDALYAVLHSTDVTAVALSSANSVPALIVAVLRAAVAHSDLPFLNQYKDRSFPLKSKKRPAPSDEDLASTSPSEFTKKDEAADSSKNNEVTEDYERRVDEFALKAIEELNCTDKIMEEINVGAHKSVFDTIGSSGDYMNDFVMSRLQRMCPEILAMSGFILPASEPPVPNIRVRHVQPMAPGKHLVCKNTSPVELEILLRRSPTSLRYKIYKLSNLLASII